MRARLGNLPVRAARPDDAAPRLQVAELALDACLFGLHAGAYPWEPAWRRAALSSVARYVGMPVPRIYDADLAAGPEMPYRSQEPLLDAVLTLVGAGGVEALTLERVAVLTGRDVDVLKGLYGSAEGLLGVVLERVLSEGFDDLMPLHLGTSSIGVKSMLDVLSRPDRTRSLLRLLLLTGVTVPGHASRVVRVLSPLAVETHHLLPWRDRVLTLAVDGWTLSAAAMPEEAAGGLPVPVVNELASLAGV